MRIALVTGGAGFIGQNLCRDLLTNGWKVRVVDNFSSSYARNLAGLEVDLVNVDLRNDGIQEHQAFRGVDCIFHLAADVDNRHSWENPHSSISNNVLSTMNVGLAAVKNGVKKIVYSSTGTVYGDKTEPPYTESESDSNQTSLYGATKYSGEAILSVFSQHFPLSVTAFRFVGVLGPGYSHGHVFDFVKSLCKDPDSLYVLGNGHQKKAYVHVADLAKALLAAGEEADPNAFSILNLGRDDYCTVRDSVTWITHELGLNPEVLYQSGDRGWVGDNPHLFLDTRKLRSTGWSPEHSTEYSVRQTARWLFENQWILTSSPNV